MSTNERQPATPHDARMGLLDPEAVRTRPSMTITSRCGWRMPRVMRSSSYLSYLTLDRQLGVIRPPWRPRYLWLSTPGTSRNDVAAALGLGEGTKPPFSREGLIATPDERYDAFFVDLQKAERDYSPTTMYRDYAINRELFHWESQSMQTDKQRRVLRWIEHQQRGGNVLLFVRDKKRSELGTQAFLSRPGDVRGPPRRAASGIHMAPPDPDAGRALRSRTKRRGRVEAAADELETLVDGRSSLRSFTT